MTIDVTCQCNHPKELEYGAHMTTKCCCDMCYSLHALVSNSSWLDTSAVSIAALT